MPESPTQMVDFPPFQLDLRAGQLRRGAAPVALRPKTFAILRHLAERPGALVTKQALLDAVWGDVAVSEDVVRISVGELREALGDERAAPRFIETVPRRGYRFIARLGVDVSADLTDAVVTPDAAVTVVGRAPERAEIASWLRAAAAGRRQIGFVCGEAGIGKTTLVDAALDDLARRRGAPLRIARGQCIEQFGGSEPYMPVLEALAGLVRGPDAAAVAQSLREHAPAWVLAVLGLDASRSAGGAVSGSSTHEHTLHKLAGSVAALAADAPLVLVLEDVQWSDYSTLDLLSVLAHGREPARLLVLATLRPADAIVRAHPVATLKRELVRKGSAREILLGGLSAADLARYLASRFRVTNPPDALVAALVDHSDGNPLFMVMLVDHLLANELLVIGREGLQLRAELDDLRRTIPDELRAIIEPRLERLAADELRALETASVAGSEFSAHAVARVAPQDADLADIEVVEEVCDSLVRRQEILRAKGESAWPDGTASARYEFRHALYHQVIYQRLPAATRRRLHQRIAEALERAHIGRTEEIAAELAAHFERSRDTERAVRYHAEGAFHARSRFAFRETLLHLEAALALLRTQPETAERLRQQMALLQELGLTLFATKGYGDEGGARAFARMREIAERLDGGLALCHALEGQLIVHTMRAELTAARALGEEVIVLAEQLGNPSASANAHVVLAATLYNLGEADAARQHAERGRALVDPHAPPLPADIVIVSCIMLASTHGYMGLVGRARTFNREATGRAAALQTPFHRALAANLAAQVDMLLDDVAGARPLADEALQLATEYDFSVLRLTAVMVRGWCDVEEGNVDEGLAAFRTAFDEYRASGQHYGTTSFSMLLARAHLAAGDVASADQVVSASLAFAAETGERAYEPEFHRLKGECVLAGAARTRNADAARHFERALAIAAERKALLFEVRAATSLYRLRGNAARERLARLADRFGAQDDCADLRAARTALAGGDSPAMRRPRPASPRT